MWSKLSLVILTCVSKNQIPSVVRVLELDTIATILDLVGVLVIGVADPGDKKLDIGIIDK
jgi:hypothetical protein